MNRLTPRFLLGLLLLSGAGSLISSCTSQSAGSASNPRTVGVALLVHGGFDNYSDAALWDSTLQIFSYDPNSFVYQRVIWNPAAWPMILRAGNAPKEQGKYSFEIGRIGGHDPAMDITREQVADLAAVLRAAEESLNVRFVVDYLNWIGDIPNMANPRAIYTAPTPEGAAMTYCGGSKSPWPGCDPERYNTDGAIERMLAAGAEEIIVIDLTTSGVRFFKSNDAIRASRALLERHNAANGTSVTLTWLNDPTDLMRESYPDKPAGWTASAGEPEHDPKVPLQERPNPVSSDRGFALLHAEGIEQHFNPDVPVEKTGIMLINHATRTHNQLFDPKIDDTLILNENIRAELLARNPGLQQTNIVGSWMGIKEENPDIKPKPPAFSKLERTRAMRGENLGHAYLYETDEEFPGGEWGYLYWDALEQLKNQGVEHIVIAFPQITVDSVLNLVELPNQIAKEIGYRNWLYIEQPDYDAYPDVGHPFADYWGIWVAKMCTASETGAEQECCFVMGGCSDGRPYPPPRQAALTKARNDLDPSLAYDVSEYGHLGYDPAQGEPDTTAPVQAQYRGTWAIWQPPNADPRVGKLLAQHVLDYVDGEDRQ